jgi:hypothetical protein
MSKAKNISDSINEVIFGRDPGMDTTCVCPECGTEASFDSPVACSSRSCTTCGSSTMTNPEYDGDDEDQGGQQQGQDPNDALEFDFSHGVGHDELLHDTDFLPKEGRPTGEYLDYRESYNYADENEQQIGLNNIGWGIGTGLSRADTPFNRFATFGPSTRKLVFTGPKATALKLAASAATHETPPVGTPGTAPIGYAGTNDGEDQKSGLRAACNTDQEPETCVCGECGYSIENTTGQDCSVIPCPQCGAL